MSLNIQMLVEKYSQYLSFVQGPENTTVIGLQTPSLAKSQHAIFVSDAEHLNAAKTSASRIWVVSKKLLSQAQTFAPQDASLLVSPNPQLVMAYMGRDFFPITKNKIPSGAPISSHASIDPSARIGKNVVIGAFTSIGPGCEIGDNCVIGSNVTIEADVKIGPNSHIHPQVFIGHSTEIGKACEIHPQTSIATEGFGYAHDEKGNHYRINHYGRVIIEDDVHIGAGVQIDRGTYDDSRIGYGTKIDNHCHFGHNIQIGKNTIVTGGMIAAGSVTIGSNCVFGGRTSIAGHLTVGDQIQVAGLSGITKSLNGPGMFGGYPLQPLKRALKSTATIAQLPEMRKNLSAALKALNLKEIVSPDKD